VRQKPVDTLLVEGAVAAGLLARVPLVSGLLTGKLTAATAFAADDHRQFNRDGPRSTRRDVLGVPTPGLHVVERLQAPSRRRELATVAPVILHDAIPPRSGAARPHRHARTRLPARTCRSTMC
jgi:hypothetical protein